MRVYIYNNNKQASFCTLNNVSQFSLKFTSIFSKSFTLEQQAYLLYSFCSCYTFLSLLQLIFFCIKQSVGTTWEYDCDVCNGKYVAIITSWVQFPPQAKYIWVLNGHCLFERRCQTSVSPPSLVISLYSIVPSRG